MTLLAMDGVGRLARERENERRIFDKARKDARVYFDEHPDGVLERDLVGFLVKHGASRSIASACADELLSQGLAKKNWTNGMLTHVS